MSIPWMSTRWARQEVRLGDTTDAPFACTLTLDAIPGVRGDVCTEACGSGRSKRQRQVNEKQSGTSEGVRARLKTVLGWTARLKRQGVS
jgi:hypothetical protein